MRASPHSISRARRWGSAALVVMMGALDVYSVQFISIPYYVGLTTDRIPDGTVTAFHLPELGTIGFGEVLTRLCLFKPFWITPMTVSVLWGSYLVATVVLVWTAIVLGGRIRVVQRYCTRAG